MAIARTNTRPAGEGLQGEVIRPGDAGYDAARKVWNGMFDRRPALITRCANVDDVRAAVRYARANRLSAAVRGGGHSFSGQSAIEGGLLIDLSGLKAIEVDVVGGTARAQGGVLWGEFDKATQAHGLATTGGLVSTTGIAGLTLGGGIGWLMRKHGLTIDNLLSVELVTADGEVLRASASENADLFWGVRGGGGNFGIVTSFEYQLHPLGPIIMGGLALYPAAQARDVLRFYREWTPTLPDALSTMAAFLTAPPLPFIPAPLHGTPVIAIIACHAGSVEEGLELVKPLKSFGPPAVDLLGPMPYVALQGMFDEGAPHGWQYYAKAEYLQGLDDATIETFVAHAAQMESPLSAIHIHQLGGAVARVGDAETAFGKRGAPYLMNIPTAWIDPAESERHTRWARGLWSAMQPHSYGGAYLNFLGDEGAERVRAAYGAAKYDRLVALKNRYDPTNFFRFNQNIAPTTQPGW